MWKILLICLLAMLSFVSSLDVMAAESKKEKVRKKKQEKKIEEVVWEKDVKTAITKAKKAKKYILLIHIAPKVNNNSKLFDQNIIKNKALAKAAKDLIFVKFEYENLKKISKEAAEAIKAYPIERGENNYIMPTVYLLDSTGLILEKKFGFQEKTPAEYLKSFKSMKKKK